MTDVLVVSRLATVRAGLRAVLAASPSLRVAGEAAALDAATVADLAGRAGLADGRDAGVVLLDAAGPDELDDAVAALDEAGPGLVVLGPTGGRRRLARLAPPVAWAALSREASAARIVAAVQAVAAGLVAYEADAEPELVGGFEGGPFPDAGAADPDDLTSREHEVLALVALGLTNKAIAQRLSISEHTAKFHVASILGKLDAESRTEAVHLAVRRGLLTL